MRYPTYWLNDRRFERIGRDGHHLFTIAMAYSVSNRTEGVIEHADIPTLARKYDCDTSKIALLVDNWLWEEIDGGYLILDFRKTQTSKSQLEGFEEKKRNDAERSKRYRESKKIADPSRDASYDDRGEERREQGKERRGEEVTRDDDQSENERDWPDVETAKAGGAKPTNDVKPFPGIERVKAENERGNGTYSR